LAKIRGDEVDLNHFFSPSNILGRNIWDATFVLRERENMRLTVKVHGILQVAQDFVFGNQNK
jgi:hypothetical protein